MSLKPCREVSCRSIQDGRRLSISYPSFFLSPFLLIISRRTVVIPGEKVDPSQCNLLSRVQRAALFLILKKSCSKLEKGWAENRGSKGKNGERRGMQKGAKRRWRSMAKMPLSLLSAVRRHNLSERLLKVKLCARKKIPWEIIKSETSLMKIRASGSGANLIYLWCLY